jgi:hypothetical protein
MEIGSTGSTGSASGEYGGPRRSAALTAGVVLACLLAADLLVTDALIERYAGDLNQLGRMLVGVGSAGVVKITAIAALIAAVILQRATRIGTLCWVWAAAGIYVTVVVMNAYTLAAAGAR